MGEVLPSAISGMVMVGDRGNREVRRRERVSSLEGADYSRRPVLIEPRYRKGAMGAMTSVTGPKLWT